MPHSCTSPHGVFTVDFIQINNIAADWRSQIYSLAVLSIQLQQKGLCNGAEVNVGVRAQQKRSHSKPILVGLRVLFQKVFVF